MSEQILNILETMRKQWGELYVTSQETTATIEQMQSQMEQMATHAERVLNFAIVISSVAFVLAVVCASVLIWRYQDERNN